MNILRKAMAREVEALKPILDCIYAAILRYQHDRTPENEAAMREAMAPAIEQLQMFRSLLPAYKQSDFRLLEEEWRTISAHDLIMLFDHCVNIMHVRLERKRSAWEAHQPWTKDMLRLLDGYRDAPAPRPVEGEFLCSGIAASGGHTTGTARVIQRDDELDSLRPGEILVCRFTRPELAPYLREVRGLVTDEGGALSHAAILARELSLPAVTGCGNATTAIRNGVSIEIDGDHGLVTAVNW